MRENPASRYRFVIEGVVCSSRVSTAVVTAAIGPLLPLIMQELDISRGTVSWFVSAPQILTVAFAVPAGILASRIGLKRTFAAGIFLEAASVIIPFCASYPLLLMARVFFGIGVAITSPIAAGVVAQWFNRKEMPLANGFNSAMSSTGQTISRFITIPIAAVLSWRGTLAVYSLVILITALLWLIIGREKPAVPPDNPGTPVARSKPVESSGKMSTWQVLRRRETLFLAFSLTGAFGLFFVLSAWLPTYYYEVFKMPLSQASSVSAIFMLGGLPAGIVGGILPSRFGFRKPILVVSGIMVGVMGIACFMVNNPLIIFPAVAAYGFFAVVYMPSVFTIPMELPGMTPRTGSLMLSLALAAGSFGGFMCPIIVGYLADFTGSYLPGFYGSCALSLSLLIGGLLLPETGPGARKSVRTMAADSATD
jgi:CP family cyanate transporter-like MFS transporter